MKGTKVSIALVSTRDLLEPATLLAFGNTSFRRIIVPKWKWKLRNWVNLQIPSARRIKRSRHHKCANFHLQDLRRGAWIAPVFASG